MGYKEYIQRGIVGMGVGWGILNEEGWGVDSKSVAACISQSSRRETEPVEIFKEAYYKVLI